MQKQLKMMRLLLLLAMGLAGNRAQGQTTTTFAFTNSAITAGGYYTAFNPLPSTSDNGLRTDGYSSQVDFNFVGTALTFPKIYVSAASGNVKYILDGGSLTTPTLSGTGTLTNQTLVSGLTDSVTHRITISFPNSSQVILDSPNFIAVTSTASTPSISAVSGYGSITVLNGNAHIAVEGISQTTTINAYASYRSSLTGGSGQVYDGMTIRFKGRIAYLWPWIYGNGEYLNLDVYDATGATLQNSYQSANYNGSGGWGGWGAGFSGLDTTADHIYELSGSGSQGFLIYSLMTSGGTGIDLTWTPPTRHYVAGGIDSITRAEIGTGGYSNLGYLRLFAKSKGLAEANFGVNGAAMDNQESGQTSIGWSASNSTTTGRYNDLLLFAQTHSVDYSFWMAGANDLQSTVTNSNFQTAFTNFINAVNGSSYLSATKNYALGILPTDYAGITWTKTQTFNGLISTAVASGGNKWKFFDTSALNYAGAAFQSGGAFAYSPNYAQTGGTHDDIHPGPTGYSNLETYLVQQIGNTFRRAAGSRAGTRSVQ